MEIDEVLLVHVAEVSGVEPDFSVRMLYERLGSLFRLVFVTQHDGGTLDGDLTFLARREEFFGAGLDDLVSGVGVTDADGAFFILGAGRQAGGRDGLGEAVALADLDARAVLFQPLVDFTLQRDRDGVASGEHTHEVGDVGVLHVFGLDEHLEEGRDAGDEVRMELLHGLRIALRIDGRDEDIAAAVDEDGVDADAETETVEDRHSCQEPQVAEEVEVDRHRTLECERVEVLVGEQDALRSAGGTAGVQDDGGAALLIRYERRGLALAGLHVVFPGRALPLQRVLRELAALGRPEADVQRELEVVLHAGDDDVDRTVDFFGRGEDFIVEEVRNEDCFTFGQGQVVDDLLFRRQRVDQRDRDTDAVEGIQRFDGLRDVRHAKGDCIAFLHAVCFECRGDHQDVLMHLVKGRRGTLEHVGRLVRQTVSGHLQHLVHGLVRVRDVHFIVEYERVILGKEGVDRIAERFRVRVIAAVQLRLRERDERALLRISRAEVADPVLRELIVLHGLQEQRRTLAETPEGIAVAGDSILTEGVVQVIFEGIVLMLAFAGSLLQDVRHGDHRFLDGVLQDETLDVAGKGTHVGIEGSGSTEVFTVDVDRFAGAVVGAVQFPERGDDVEFLLDAPHGERLFPTVAFAVVPKVHRADGCALCEESGYQVLEIAHPVGAVAVDAEQDALFAGGLPKFGRDGDTVISDGFEGSGRFLFEFLSGNSKRTPRDFVYAEFFEGRIDMCLFRCH